MDDYTERYKDIIIPIIEKHIPEVRIILYGSRARKDCREGSDIDIALDAGGKINKLLISKLMSDLDDSCLVVPFDVVDFYAVSEDMQKNILKDGVIWKK